jgi:hypothetical protein
MNNKLKMLLAAGALVVGAQQAQAISYQDADNWQTAGVGTTIGIGGSVSSDFNIVADDVLQADTFTVETPPYNTSTQNGGKTYHSILGYTPGDPILDGSVNFWLRNSAGDTVNILVGLGTLLESANSGSVIFKSEGLNLTLAADLQADGIINYTVSNIGPSDVIFDYALLIATVPDGGMTAMLLGLGFLGIAGLRRKLS